PAPLCPRKPANRSSNAWNRPKILHGDTAIRLHELQSMIRSYIWPLTVLALAWFAPGVAAQVSSGTAFSVAPETLVTNHHVIAGCQSVDVIAADGRRTGSIVDADKRIDLALLRVSGIKGEVARIRSPRTVRLGEPVMVFGFPLTGALSSGGNFTSGLVSALRGLKDAAGELQITAPVQPGNSGGPLMDASGLVIGVVQAKLDAIRTARAIGDIPQNVNFAISLEVLADFLTKNKVGFREGTFSTALDTAQVAQVAQRFTYRIECNRSQQARSVSPPNIRQVRPSPKLKQDRPPPNVARDPDLARSRSDVIQKIKETRAQAEKLLALHEAQRLQALEEYNRRRDL